MAEQKDVGCLVDELNKFKKHWATELTVDFDSVIHSITHPMSQDPGDIKAMLWIVSQVLEVPVLRYQLEELEEVVCTLQDQVDSIKVKEDVTLDAAVKVLDEVDAKPLKVEVEKNQKEKVEVKKKTEKSEVSELLSKLDPK